MDYQKRKILLDLYGTKATLCRIIDEHEDKDLLKSLVNVKNRINNIIRPLQVEYNSYEDKVFNSDIAIQEMLDNEVSDISNSSYVNEMYHEAYKEHQKEDPDNIVQFLNSLEYRNYVK